MSKAKDTSEYGPLDGAILLIRGRERYATLERRGLHSHGFRVGTI